MKRYINFNLIAVTISAFTLLACGGKGAGTQQAPPPVSVSSYPIESKKVTGIDEYPATVVPVNEIEIRPQVSGYITNIFVRDGQLVEKGQRLYEIDRSKYTAAKNQASAALASAKANLARVQKDVSRYERLDEQEAIAKQVLDNAKAELLSAEAQVQVAEAQIASADTDLSYSLITAPFAGRIGISQVRLGTQVSPGQPLLNSLSSDDPVQVDFVINEREIPRFTRLINSTDSPDSLFTLRVSGNTLYPQPGKLIAIDRAVGRQSGTINVRVEFPNPDRELVPGMTVNLRIINEDYGNQLVIPYKAVTEQMGEYFVYVIEGDTAVRQQTLRLGTLVGADIVVREGLTEGQKIVVDGIQKLRPGSKITVD